MNIRDYIGFGRINAKTRKELVAETGIPDVQVRAMIRKSRLDEDAEDVIVSFGGDGYFRTNDPDLIDRFVRTEKAREDAIHASNAKMRVVANRLRADRVGDGL